jgi:hypothetical protein
VVFPFEAHLNEKWRFSFNTDLPFDPNNSRTWPFSLTIQKLPSFYRYQTYTMSGFAQDDWRVSNRIHLNIGMRDDFETTRTSPRFSAPKPRRLSGAGRHPSGPDPARRLPAASLPRRRSCTSCDERWCGQAAIDCRVGSRWTKAFSGAWAALKAVDRDEKH